MNSATNIKSDGNTDIFPNPSDGKFSMSFNSNVQRSIIVTNLLGETIYETKTTSNTEIDLGSQRKGIYFVTIVGEGIYETKKLIIK